MDVMRNMGNMIERYAALTAMRDHYGTRGGQLPPEMQQEIIAIEARAQSSLTPQQLHMAQTNAFQMKQQYMQNIAVQEQTDAVINHAAVSDGAFKNMTKDMLGQKDGLNKRQFEAVIRGQKVPIKGTEKIDLAKLETLSRTKTRTLSKDGRGLSYADAKKVATELESAKANKTHAEYDKFLQNTYGKKWQDFKGFEKGWADSNLHYKIELQARAAKKDQLEPDHYIEPSDSDTMRAELIRNMARTNGRTDDGGHDQGMANAQDAWMLGNEGYSASDDRLPDMTRSLANAWDMHDTEEEDYESDYRPETYDEDELESSNG